MFEDMTTVGHNNTRRFLSAVLKGEKTKIGYARRIFMSVNAENTALLTGTAVSIQRCAKYCHFLWYSCREHTFQS